MIWSSPVRKSGTVDMSPIPNEIYMEIFSYLRPTDPNEWVDAEARQHFCNLALVCRFFSSVMLPWIFENLTFIEKDLYSQIRSPLSSSVSAKFCRSVLDGDTTALLLAKHVKRWAFLGSPNQSKWTPAFLSMYFETFQHLPNLLELSLSNIVIPKDFFKRLAHVPTLETLKLEDSLFDEGVRRKHLKHFESLPLKRLALVHPVVNNHLRRLVPHLNMTSLIRLELDVFPLLSVLPPCNNSPLEYLYLGSVEDPSRIAQLLEDTPYLKILRLPHLQQDALLNFVLKPLVIPQLTELRASWALCAKILPGRTISRLELYPPLGELGMDGVKTFASSTNSLVELQIPLPLFVGVPFLMHFPGLQTLRIRGMCYSGGAWVQSVNSAFKESSHPNLRSLGLEFKRGTSIREIDSEERQVLDFLDMTFPVLTSVDFSSFALYPFRFNPHVFHCETWSYTRVVGGSWHRTFRITHYHP